MAAALVRLLLENVPEQRFMEAIYPEEIAAGTVVVEAWITSSGAIGAATGALLQHPETPVALVLNTRTTDDAAIAETYHAVQQILGRAAPGGSYHVALAIPRLDAWAIQDPVVSAAFAAEERTTGDSTSVYVNRSVRMADICRNHAFNRAALRAASTQFRGLDDFIKKHLHTPKQPKSALAF